MRRPIDVAATTKMGTREEIWQLMRSLKAFTVLDLCMVAPHHDRSVALYCRSLMKAGYLTRDKVSSGKATGVSKERYRYTIVKDAPEAPRLTKDGEEVTQGRGREQMWRTIRILRHLGLADLCAAAATEERAISRDEAARYLRYLTRARYLRQTGTGDKAQYLLVRNTGPKAPQVQRVRRVWDPNLKQVTWPRRGDQEEVEE